MDTVTDCIVFFSKTCCFIFKCFSTIKEFISFFFTHLCQCCVKCVNLLHCNIWIVTDFVNRWNCIDDYIKIWICIVCCFNSFFIFFDKTFHCPACIVCTKSKYNTFWLNPLDCSNNVNWVCRLCKCYTCVRAGCNVLDTNTNCTNNVFPCIACYIIHKRTHCVTVANKQCLTDIVLSSVFCFLKNCRSILVSINFGCIFIVFVICFRVNFNFLNIEIVAAIATRKTCNTPYNATNNCNCKHTCCNKYRNVLYTACHSFVNDNFYIFQHIIHKTRTLFFRTLFVGRFICFCRFFLLQNILLAFCVF